MPYFPPPPLKPLLSAHPHPRLGVWLGQVIENPRKVEVKIPMTQSISILMKTPKGIKEVELWVVSKGR